MDPADGWGSVGHGRYSLSAAHTVDLSGAAKTEGCEKGGVDFAVRTGWSRGDDLVYASGGGQRARHDRGRNERGCAAGNVNANAAEGFMTLTDDGTLPVFHEPTFFQAPFRKGFHIRLCGLNGFCGFGREFGQGGGDFLRRHRNPTGFQIGAAEFFCITQECGIALFGNGREDFFDGSLDGGIRCKPAI